MRLHDHFEWDPGKARANQKKHGVTFDDAAAVLADEEGDVYHLEEYDDEHSDDEERFVTTASDPDEQSIILVFSWTDRSTDDAQVTRIITHVPRLRRKGSAMPKKSPASDAVHRSAEIPAATPSRLDRLRAAMDAPIDTSDIPERKGPASRVVRDKSGRLPAVRPSVVRDAILTELDRRGMNRYQLWQDARAKCPTLPQSAVYEFLRGQREIGLPYVEALMASAGLYVARIRSGDD